MKLHKVKRECEKMRIKKIVDTPYGKINIVQQGNFIVQVILGEGDKVSKGESELLLQAEQQLKEYLAGNRKQFDLPLDLQGTAFQRKVWQELLNIPYGTTRTYKEIAERIGIPKAARAVGMANHNNPIPIFVPCHRVIGANGKLVGYAYGVEMKKKLLELERNVERGR